MEQVPSEGRIVHVHTSIGSIRPAIITHVYDDHTVDLVVFNGEERIGDNTIRAMPAMPWMRVPQGTGVGCWWWPPRTPRPNEQERLAVGADVDTKQLANELNGMALRLNIIAAQLLNMSAPPMLMQPLQRARAALEEAVDEARLIYK